MRAVDVALSGRPLRIALALLFALSAAFVGLCLQAVVTAGPPYRFGDFHALWSSAVLAHAGDAATNYDFDALHLRQLALGMRDGEHNPFPYPPPFLLLIAPLGGLARPAAYALFIGLSFALYLWASMDGRWRDWRRAAGAFAAPATGINLVFGQTGFLSGGLMLGGLNLAERRPILAGALFGLLAFKPQLGLLVPVALVAAGLWRTIAAAAATVLLCAAAAAAAFGADVWRQWFAALVAYSHMRMTDRLMPTIAGGLSLAGAPAAVALAAQAAAAIVVGVVVWRACRGGLSPRAAALVVVGTFLATPHALVYDLPMTTAAIVWRIDSRLQAARSLHLGEIAVLALALALPLAELALGGRAPPLAWAPEMALFALIAVDPYGRRAAARGDGSDDASDDRARALARREGAPRRSDRAA